MTYFVVSDVHSCLDALKKSLKEEGFDEKNPFHTLVIAGDVFDRGNQTRKLYNYLTRTLKGRVILIRGNHELLYQELLEKKMPDGYDYSNGTVRTFCDIAREEEFFYNVTGEETLEEYEALLEKRKKFLSRWKIIKEKVRNSVITKWIQDDTKWVNYLEIGDYIIVHAFIPSNYALPFNIELTKVTDWRNCNYWDDAMWSNPMKCIEEGLFDEEIKKGKILISGHIGTYHYHREYERQVNNYDIFKRDNFIGLDATTILSDKVNVYKIEVKE